MQDNKTAKMPFGLRQPSLRHKLSNIVEDLEEENRPTLSPKKKKNMHTSDVRLQNKLKRIINQQSGRQNKSVQSHYALCQ